MLIKRVYEVDPLACPKCGGTMKVVAFIEPPQGDVIEKILRHCGLWNPPARPPPGDCPHFCRAHAERGGKNGTVPFGVAEGTCGSDEPHELTCVDEDTFWATF